MILFIIVTQLLDVGVYRFDAGYVEVWYQLPIAALVDSQEFNISLDTISVSFPYVFSIRNEDGSDSAVVQGDKSVCLCKDDLQDFIVDYLPLSLYQGEFLYEFEVRVKKGVFREAGNIKIPADTVSLFCSDLVLGRKGFAQFMFHDIPMLPSVNADFRPVDQLLSYLELYGLVPDSLSYIADYFISDHTDAVLLHDKRGLLKYDYVQTDTHVVDLSRLVSGKYKYTVRVSDPASASSVTRSNNFTITTSRESVERAFYRDVQYLLSSNEYKEFSGMSDIQQEIYLQEFWRHHDYQQFERYIFEADKMFSAGDLLGRDSERGRLYIMLGPPDEIETMTLENWARPFEVWHYYGRNDFLFSDIRNDHNPRLIKMLKPGELTDVLNTGMREGSRDEEWLSDIAPGTYDWYEDKTSPE